MDAKVHRYILIVIAFVTFYLIESFYNICLYINSLLFVNLGVILKQYHWLILYIAVIFLVLILFGSKLIKTQFKLLSLLLTIILARVFAQFFLTPEFYLFTNLLLFLTTVLFYVEIFLVWRKVSFLDDYRTILGGIILGLGINYAFYLINATSNLSTEISKFPVVVFFTPVLIHMGLRLFHPSSFKTFQVKSERSETKLLPRNFPIIFFLFGGICFSFVFNWLLSPVTLSAYDSINLGYNNIANALPFSWVSFGFTYYIVVILTAGCLSFYAIQRILSINSHTNLKIVIVSSNIVTCLLNCMAFLFLETDQTILSIIYLTILVVCGVFTILLDFSFVIRFYSIKGRLIAYFGTSLFILGLIISIIIQILISWVDHSSLLLSITAFALICLPLFITISLKKINLSIRKSLDPARWNKTLGSIFLSIMVLISFSFGVLAFTRTIASPASSNPTFLVYNIHNCVGVDSKFDIDRIVHLIKTEDPDIVGLNEVDMGSIKTGFVDLPSYFAYKLQMYYFYGPTFYQHYGNLLLSKYPIIEVNIYPLPVIVPGSEPRSFIRAVIRINSQNWTIYITHLSTKQGDRLAQLNYSYSNSLLSVINQSVFTRVVCMGDFNLDPFSTEYGMFNASVNKFRDTHLFLNSTPGLTGGFNDDAIPTRRIDYILCSPDLVPTASKVICSIASDHCAVLTKF